MASAITSPANSLEPLVLLAPADDGGIRITRDGYWRLIQTGVFGPRPRIELVDGEILMMSPIGPMHGTLVRRLDWFLQKSLPESIECSVQLPIIVGDHSEPEPDIALIRHRDDGYQHQHPSPGDIVLLIEVAQSSLHVDLGKKLRVYAAGEVPEYWVVDVGQKLILVHRIPVGAAYQDVQSLGLGSKVAPIAAADCVLDIAWLFH